MNSDDKAKAAARQAMLDRIDAIKKQTANSDDMEQRKALFIEAFKLQACVVSKACSAVNISRQTYYNWLKDDKIFAARIEEQEDEIIDLAESKLLDNINKGKETSLIFYLCNRRPDRWQNIQRVDMAISNKMTQFNRDIADALNAPAPDEVKLYSDAQLAVISKAIKDEESRRQG